MYCARLMVSYEGTTGVRPSISPSFAIVDTLLTLGRTLAICSKRFTRWNNHRIFVAAAYMLRTWFPCTSPTTLRRHTNPKRGYIAQKEPWDNLQIYYHLTLILSLYFQWCKMKFWWSFKQRYWLIKFITIQNFVGISGFSSFCKKNSSIDHRFWKILTKIVGRYMNFVPHNKMIQYL